MKKIILLILVCIGYLYPQASNTIPRRVDTLETSVDSLYTKTSHIVNVKEFGAVGDGMTDDTQAFQDALDYFYNNGSYRTGKVVIPIGQYKITRTLTYEGVPAYAFTLEGEQGSARLNTGTNLLWYGEPKGTMLYLLAGNAVQLKNFGIKGNTQDTTSVGSLETGIWLDGTNTDTAFGAVDIATFIISGNTATVTTDTAHHQRVNSPVRIAGVTGYNGLYIVKAITSATSFTFSYIGDDYSTTGGTAQKVKSSGGSGVRMEYLSVYYVNGYDCAGIRFANGDNVSSEQVSEVYMEHVQLLGNDGYLGSALKWEQGGNVCDFWFEKGAITNFYYGFNAGSNGILSIKDISVSTIPVLTKFSTAVMNLSGIRGEGVMMIAQGGSGGNSGILNIQGCQFNIDASDTTDVILNYQGVVNLIGNQFFNFRTPTSEPKFIIGDITNIAGGNSSFYSAGNYYHHAYTYPCVYVWNTDSTNLVFNGSRYIGQKRGVYSFGDTGGDFGAAISLTDFSMGGKRNDDGELSFDALEGLSINKLAVANVPTDTSGLRGGDIYTNLIDGKLSWAIPQNLCSNGDFGSWYNTYKSACPTDWHPGTTDTTKAYMENVNNQMHVVSDGTILFNTWAIKDSLEIGEIYNYSFDIVSITGNATFSIGYTAIYSVVDTLTAGHYSGEITAVNEQNFAFYVPENLGFTLDMTIDNIRVWKKTSSEMQTPMYYKDEFHAFLDMEVDDIIPFNYYDKATTIDSIRYDVDDSVTVQITHGVGGTEDTLFVSNTVLTGRGVISSFYDNTITAGSEVQLYITAIGDNTVKWWVKAYRRE